MPLFPLTLQGHFDRPICNKLPVITEALSMRVLLAVNCCRAQRRPEQEE